MKKCKTCSARVGRKKRRMPKKITTGRITKIAMDGVKVYLGMAAGRALTNNVGVLQGNPALGIGAKLVIAVVLSNGKTAPIALGMASEAINQAANTFAPGLTQSLGIGGLGSFAVPGVGRRTRVGQKKSVPYLKIS